MKFLCYNADMRKDDYDIFINKTNSTHWAKDFDGSILPFDDYYKVLLRPSTLIEKYVGYFAKTNTTNKISIYKNAYNHYIAQVTSYKKYQEHIKYTKDQRVPSVSVATYINWYDEIILLNHFDAIGRAHSNDYSMYSEDVRPMYEKYFTDKIIEQNGQTYYHSGCPHFHFCSATQTEANETQEHPNAISTKQLYTYLTDLKNCKDLNSPLLQYDLDMPFLTYYLHEEKYKYISIFPDLAKKVLNLSCKAKKCEDVVEYMHKIEHMFEISKPKNNIEKIMLDLRLLHKLIKKFETNLELVAMFSNAFVKSVNMKAVEAEHYKGINK